MAAHRSARWLIAPAALLLALLVAAGVLGMRALRYQDEESRRQQVLAAARQLAVDFTTLDYRHGQSDFQAVLAGSTGDFHQEFSNGLSELSDLVAKNRSVSRGEVLEAGLVSSDADSARVLLVVDSTVSNKSVPKGQLRHYRIQLDLRHQGGKWLASSLQFVS